MDQLFLTKSGRAAATDFTMDLDRRTGDVLAVAAAESDGLIFLVGGPDEPLNLDISLRENGVKKDNCLHVHRCRLLAVAVTYNGAMIAGEFRPHSEAQSVVDWAVRQPELRIPSEQHGKFQLRTPENNPIKPDAHIGAYVVGDRCGATFVLAEHPKAQG